MRFNFKKKNKIQKKDITLGYAGRYAKQKNIKSLLLAFSKIIKHHDNVYLYMVGKNISNKNKELSNFVSELKIKKKIFFLNEQKNLLEFYNGIDILVLASHSESFPNVIAEAMLCSTPVLASNAGCSKKIVDKYGFIMDKNDHLSITKNLNKTIDIMVNKKKKWKFLKKSARIQIQKNFSIEKMTNNYLKNWIF